jgi:aerobic-type carbon monoxide dehydrogenase small subunit (CoxS/CutS family)
MSDSITFTLNGNAVALEMDAQRPLLWVLRGDLGLTGTKYGCGEGHCGACTILLNGRAVRSCLLTAQHVQGKEVVTIEGLAPNDKLHPVQTAFMQHDGMQCGFCTPGMVLTAVALLNSNPNPSRDEILRGMEENFCRCGAQTRIVDAIQAAAEMKGAAS